LLPLLFGASLRKEVECDAALGISQRLPHDSHFLVVLSSTIVGRERNGGYLRFQMLV
jgi:hypothetical protein